MTNGINLYRNRKVFWTVHAKRGMNQGEMAQVINPLDFLFGGTQKGLEVGDKARLVMILR